MNKKINTLQTKINYWAAPLLLVLLLIGSCKKELLMDGKKNSSRQLTVAELQQSFGTNAEGTALNSNTSGKAKRSPYWNLTASIALKNGGNMLSVPLGIHAYDRANGTQNRLTAYKDSLGEIHAVIMAIKPDSTYLANVKGKVYLQTYTGHLLLFSTAQEFLRGYIYEKGKIIGQLKLETGGNLPVDQNQVQGWERECEWRPGYSYTNDEGGVTHVSVKYCRQVWHDAPYSEPTDPFATPEALEPLPDGPGADGNQSLWEYYDCINVINGEAIESPCGCIGGTTGIEVCPPKEEQIKDAIENKPFALFDSIDCQTLKKWINVAKFIPPQSVIDDLGHLTALATNQGFYTLKMANIQKLDDAYSTIVNMDYFPVTITQLPIVNGQRLGPGQFLNYIRTNINSFTGGSEQFIPYNAYGVNDGIKWYSTNPLGAIVAINIPGPDNGSVITSYSSTDRWTFTTIHEPMYGDHPVSGNRDFGYNINPNGSYTFYTRGVDRLTSWDGASAQSIPDFFKAGAGIPFNQADALWTTFQNSINNFVQSHQGGSSVSQREIFRPDWQKVKDVLSGKKPLSTLSKNCPD